MTNTKNRGQFPVGRSGNSAGRPKGTGEAAQWRAALGKDAGKVIATVTRLAVAGDVGCCRLVLERCVPAYKPADNGVRVDIPADATLTEKAAAMVDAMAAGTISPQAAASMIAALATLVRVTEVDDVVRRIAALEADLNREPNHEA